IATADLLLCDSKATVRDFCRLVPNSRARVMNIAGATDPAFAALPGDQVDVIQATLKRRYGFQNEFLLSVSGDDFRKNTCGAIKTYAALPDSYRSRYDLVVVCHLRDSTQKQLQRVATELGIADHVKFLGFVTDAELTALYQSCRLFLFPSL